MDNRSHFRSLDELIRGLDRERALLKEMFARRKTYSFRYDIARELAAKKEESLEFLRRNGVIRDNGEFVELEDVYLKFFEEVLEVNEEINVASVKQSIDTLNENIEYYLIEKSPAKKHAYLTDKKKAKSLCKEYNRKLIELLPDAEERLALARQVEKEIVTNKWLDCEEDNYWVEDSEQGSKYITLVSVASESYDDKNDKTITEQFIYLRDNCPYGWGTLVKCGAKYMVIERPKK